MMSPKITPVPLIVFTVLTLLISSSTAQSLPADYLNCHNSARAQVGVANITWSASLASYAQTYANQRISDCALTHSGGPYGENLAKGSSSGFSGTTAVNLWVAEKQYYSYSSNACIGTNQCLHYTQVVWRNSVNVGCARVQCTNGWYYVICSYDPPGNWVGEKPY